MDRFTKEWQGHKQAKAFRPAFPSNQFAIAKKAFHYTSPRMLGAGEGFQITSPQWEALEQPFADKDNQLISNNQMEHE